MPRYSNFIFDLDGTLVRIPVDWEGVRTNLRATFKTTDSFSPLFESLERFLEQRPQSKARAFALIDDHELRALPESSLIDGVKSGLEALSSRANLSLVTMQGRRACDAVVSKFGLAALLQCLVTREDSLKRSQQIETAMRRFRARKDQVLFVGDRLNDFNAARAVGVDVALIGSRPATDARPDLRFGRFADFNLYFSKS